MKLYIDGFGKLPLFAFSLVAMVGCSAEVEENKPKVKLTPLQSCLKKVERSDRSCVLMSFGGMSSLRQNPKVAAQCRAQKFEETKWCYEQFN